MGIGGENPLSGATMGRGLPFGKPGIVGIVNSFLGDVAIVPLS
jgi:hypothetical protein